MRSISLSPGKSATACLVRFSESFNSSTLRSRNYLLRRSSAAKDEKSGGHVDADPRDPRVNILIADDEPLVRDALTAFLSDKDNCTVAGSAEEALECIRT